MVSRNASVAVVLPLNLDVKRQARQAQRLAESRACGDLLLGILAGEYDDWLVHGGAIIPDEDKPWLRVVRQQARRGTRTRKAGGVS